MVLEDKTKGYEPERYRYAAAAAEFVKGKDITSSRKCLDKLLVDMGATDEDIQAGMVWNAYKGDTQKTMEGVARGIEIYAGKYQDSLGKKTINEMFERYSEEFDKYLTPEQKEKAGAVFGKLGEKNYASIVKEVKKLNKIINDEEDLYSNEEKEKAQKELENKYANVVKTIQEFEELRINKLMPPIRESTIKDNVNGRFKAEKK